MLGKVCSLRFDLQLVPKTCAACFKFITIARIKAEGEKNILYSQLETPNHYLCVYAVIPTQGIYLQVKYIFFYSREKQSYSSTCACHHYSCALFHFHG